MQSFDKAMFFILNQAALLRMVPKFPGSFILYKKSHLLELYFFCINKLILQMANNPEGVFVSERFLDMLSGTTKILIFFLGIFKVIPREPNSYSDMRVWAHKTTALACENLMLALRAYGYDSCPMEGMDSKRVKKMLNLPRKAEVCMVISVGKRASNGVYGKRFRMSSDKFIKII